LICGALLAGALVFGAIVALAAAPGATGDGPDLRLLWIIGAVYTATAVPAGFALRAAIWRKLPEQEGAARQQTYAIGTLLLWAALESCILLNCVLWLVTGSALPSAAIASAVFLLALLLGMPSAEQLEALGGRPGGG
jgi:hypothetical protein